MRSPLAVLNVGNRLSIRCPHWSLCFFSEGTNSQKQSQIGHLLWLFVTTLTNLRGCKQTQHKYFISKFFLKKYYSNQLKTMFNTRFEILYNHNELELQLFGHPAQIRPNFLCVYRIFCYSSLFLQTFGIKKP